MDKTQHRNLTNSVLVASGKGKKILFLPAYMRVAFKKITSLDVQGGSAEMSATVILSIYYKGLSKATFEEIKKNLEVAVNNEQFFSLDPDPNRGRDVSDGKVYGSNDQKKGEYTVQWRNKLPLEMDCEVFLTPFELLDLSITFAIRSISWGLGEGKVNVKFNLMDSPNSDLVTKFSLQDNEDVGEYGIAESTVNAKYLQSLSEEDDGDEKDKDKKKKSNKYQSNESVSQSPLRKEAPSDVAIKGKKDVVDIKNWQYARFKIGMYRYPFTTILMVFIPVLLLAVINLAIFFQDTSFSGRVASVATLMVAYSAFLPTIRGSIPPSPNITLFDIILYSLILSSVLCLISSFIDREKVEFQFDWVTDPYFMISLIVVLLSAFIVSLGLIIHKCKWEKQYNEGEGKFKHKNKSGFKSNEWQNEPCDKYFKSLMEDGVDIVQLSPKESVDFTQGPQSHRGTYQSEPQTKTTLPQLKHLRKEKNEGPLPEDIGSRIRLI